MMPPDPKPESPLAEQMADHFEDYDDDDDYCAEEDAELDCQLRHDGQCGAAGTEWCDFECPNRESELFAGSAAYNRKHGIK